MSTIIITTEVVIIEENYLVLYIFDVIRTTLHEI